jgi:hypothetical protein
MWSPRRDTSGPGDDNASMRMPHRSPPGLRLIAIALAGWCALTGCSAGPGSGPAATTTPAGSGSPSAPAGPASAGTTPGAPVSSAPAGARAGAAACSIFPADNVWHADVSHLPVLGNSAALVASVGTSRGVHADFGAGNYDGGPIGIPVTTVPAGTAGVKVTFQYASESDRGPYPIPARATIEGGAASDGDRHVILYDPAACRAYELYAAYPNTDGSWRAGSGAVFDLRANALRAKGWTSADAAGLSVLAGLVRYDEVAAGRIDHAIRVTAPHSRDSFVWPARHAASDSSDAALPAMGQRFRLRSSVDTSKLPTQARVVAEAMKRYGLILADNGSPWYISGAPDDRWSNDALHALGGLTGADFEAVDAGSLMVSPDSAACRT